jgi:hypothetical protein
MTYNTKGKDHFISSPVIFGGNDQQKTLSIPIKSRHTYDITQTSKSWDGHRYSNEPNNYKKNFSMSPWSRTYLTNYPRTRYYLRKPGPDFKPYDPISNCKSAGIIPYTVHNGIVYFLLQQAQYPLRRKDFGWNDFGGKRISYNESTIETAAREFSEETSCLFYLKEKNTTESNIFYDRLKDNIDLYYNNETIMILKNILPLSQKYYVDRITEYLHPVYISSKETYISYFVKVNYIPEPDLPRAEDIHIPYEIRYIRTCKWFNFEELMSLNEKDFHKRLQITKIQQRINDYFNKKHFC